MPDAPVPYREFDPDTFRPLGDKYLVRRDLAPEQSEGGIWLPDRYRQEWNQGEVLAVGPGRLRPCGSRSGMWVEVGERVLFEKYAFQPVPHQEFLYGTVTHRDVVAVADPDNGEVWPMNDWVLVEQDEDLLALSPIVECAEEWRPKPCSGRLIRSGPGQYRKHPSGFTWLADCEQIAGVALFEDCRWEDTRVYWDRTCEVIAVGQSEMAGLLLRAADLMLWEPDPGPQPEAEIYLL